MRTSILSGLAAIAASLALTLLPAAPARSAADVAYTLDNGLKVILAPQPGNPVISARILIKAGSSYEAGAGEHGLAHLMEHMAFKGTSRRSVGEISKEVERNGGIINAYTSFDETVYWLALPSEKLETAVDILSDMVFHPAYDPDEYAREKEVVIEEIRQSGDNPLNEFFNSAFSEGFGKDNPYGHRVLGSAESVAAASRETAFAFHEKFYRPDNAVLIVAGGFDPEQAKALAAKYLADLTRPDSPVARQPVSPPPKEGPKVRIIRSPDAQTPRVLMAFACPSSRDSGAPEGELLGAVLSAGDASRMTEIVRDKLKLATSIGSDPFLLQDAGLFLVIYETTPEKILPAMDAAVAELNRVASEPPDADELARARALAAMSFVRSQEAPTSLSGQISAYELLYGDYRIKDAFLSVLQRIVPADLTRLASSVFTPDNATVVVLLPQGAPELDEAALKASVAKLAPPAPAAAPVDAPPAFEPVTLKSGAKLFVLRDPSLPLVEIKAAVIGGRLAEKPGQEGLATVAASVWSRASERLAAPLMARAIEGIGAGVNGYSGRNTTGLDGSFLSSDWKAGLALFAELLINPAFSQDDFDLKKEEHLTYLKDLDEDLSDRVFRIARKSLFRDHPYGIETYGTADAVSKLSREDALTIYRDLARPERMVFAVAGDVTAEEAAKALDEALEFWKPGPSSSPPVQIPEAPEPLSGPVMASEALDREQTHIVITFLAPGMGDKDEAALAVLDSLLSGMGGVLFAELRDKKSLAYSVGSSFGSGLATGSFSFFIACAPDKTSEAVSGILEIIRDSRDVQYSKEVVDAAKEYLVGTNKIQRETLSSRVGESAFFELYGLGQDRNDKFLAAVAAVTPEEVKKAAEKYLTLERSVLSVVGSQPSIDAAEGIYSAPKAE
ncbi:MAG: insulinase family protein [Deltaproteobacteria bacterium]|jgi:zinc protease|nr:insulinase family protein [Deltaproteobacteria bacterium]